MSTPGVGTNPNTTPPATTTEAAGGAAPADATKAPSTAAPASSGAADLLPAPANGAGIDISMLYLMMADLNEVQQKEGKADVEDKTIAKNAAREAQRKAEEDAKKHDGGFFKKILPIAKVVAIVAAAAATVVSFGTLSPVLVGVALALSAGGFVVSETKCLDGVLGQGWSQWVGLGMSIAGSVVLGFGGGGGGALLIAANAVGGTAKVVEGVATIAVAVDEHKADEDMIAAKKQEQIVQRLQRAIEDIITKLEDSKDQYRRSSETVANISKTISDTDIVAAGGRA